MTGLASRWFGGRISARIAFDAAIADGGTYGLVLSVFFAPESATRTHPVPRAATVVESDELEVGVSRRIDTTGSGRSRPQMKAVAEAAIVMGVFVAVLWAIQVGDSVTHYPLLRLGIEPRSVGKLEDIVSAPFIHASYAHLIGNTLPLLVLGFLVALRGVGRFLQVTGVVLLVSGLGVWLTAPSGTDTVGVSGVIFGYFGFLVTRGIVERRATDLVVAVLVGILYWSILAGLIPGNSGISWQAHLFGLLGGVFAAWMFRQRRGTSSPEASRPRGLKRNVAR